MKTYKGYPAEVHIDGETMTVNDVERLILSLYWDKEISKRDNERLSEDYKRERQRWLDSQFTKDEESAKRLNEVAAMFTAAEKRMENTAKSMAAEVRERCDSGAKRIVLHVEIGDLLGGPSAGITDEDAELWDALCGEECNYYPYWGVSCLYVDLTHDKKWNTGRQEDKARYTPEQQLSVLRDAYLLAWQDIIRIPRFVMTVEKFF